MKGKIAAVFLVLVCSTSTLFAQLELNGDFNIGFTSAGEQSSFVTNFVPNDFRYAHFSIPQINLFAFAPINNQFFFQARLQTDTWGTGELSLPRFTLANITWENPNRPLSVTAGQFITPVGFYSDRNLLIDRTFLDLPLMYSYFVNISDQRGFWPTAGNQGAYTTNDVGLTSIYFGSYTTGAMIDWEIEEDKIRLEAALTAVAPASDREYTNLANAAFQSHITYIPSIEWQLGLSASYGSFFQQTPINATFRDVNALEQYRQLLAGIDVRYAIGYWEIVAEGLFSHWNVPGFVGGSFQVEGDRLVEYQLSNIGTNIDIRFEPPFLTGSFIAARYDRLTFLDADDPLNSGTLEWDEDVERISGAFGYKLGRNTEFKLSFSDQTPFDTSRYSFQAVISAFF
ncbi:MAG: hypothetical protein AAFW89_08470 [Bacteroidota bacterium]